MNETLEFAKAISANRRKAYFILETVRSPRGELVPCIAIEGVAGFYQTDWEWGTSITKAEKCAQDMNNRLGLTTEDVDKIVISTMKAAVFN